ncbi:hypothetical protein DFH09DRAFT_1472800 [Mycena vulgaris]|nr:hypothetical protein DFH09DRAFT_1472800 [Mycena vulgaris]
MRFAFIFSALATSAVVAAQNIVQVVTVQVGGGGDKPIIYTPNNITALNDTIVSFQFTGSSANHTNHTVTQSSFVTPCEPLANGFDSGWVPVADSFTTPPTWNLTITNDQIPIWFYCKQLLKSPHCLAGMVGVINVKNGPNSLSAFTSAAAAATTVGEATGGFSGVGAFATGAPAAGSNSTTAAAPPGSSATDGTPPPPATSAPPKGSALSTGVNYVTMVFTTLVGMAFVL